MASNNKNIGYVLSYRAYYIPNNVLLTESHVTFDVVVRPNVSDIEKLVKDLQTQVSVERNVEAKQVRIAVTNIVTL